LSTVFFPYRLTKFVTSITPGFRSFVLKYSARRMDSAVLCARSLAWKPPKGKAELWFSPFSHWEKGRG
jgi:hypothetical protein